MKIVVVVRVMKKDLELSGGKSRESGEESTLVVLGDMQSLVCEQSN